MPSGRGGIDPFHSRGREDLVLVFEAMADPERVPAGSGRGGIDPFHSRGREDLVLVFEAMADPERVPAGHDDRTLIDRLAEALVVLQPTPSHRRLHDEYHLNGASRPLTLAAMHIRRRDV